MSTSMAHLPSQSSETDISPIQPWLVCFAASLFFFFEFMQVNMFNALDPSLIRAFNMPATQLGHLSACYFYGNVLFLFPAGMILDRFSTRWIVMFAMFFCVLCTLLFSQATAVWQAELCRLVTGIGGAFCLLSCVRLASRWFPPRRMALVVGLIVTFAMVGGMVAQTPFTILTDEYGWRRVLMGDSLVGFVMLAIVVLLVRDFPKGMKKHFEAEKQQLAEIGFWPAMYRTVTNTQNWLAGLYASFVNLPIFLLGATWGSLYLVQIHHLSREDASFITSMLFVGMIVGSPAMGWISDRLRRRKLPMVLGAILSLAIIIAIMYGHHLSFALSLFLFFGLGFAISSQIISYALVAESNPAVLTGTSEGLASVLIMAGGFTIPMFPELLNVHWVHTIVNKIPVYSLSNYRYAMMIMPVAFILAIVASFFLKETRCRAFEEAPKETATHKDATVVDTNG